MDKITNVILSGGIGSRLWPLSRKALPKQYLQIFNGKSLLEMTIERNADVTNKIIFVGNNANCHLSEKNLMNSGVNYIDIIETVPRNTAAAIAFAAFASEPEDILLVTPSDHIIQGNNEYKKAVNEAVLKAKQNFVVTFGIQPTRPEIGYGYIEHRGDQVISFREKPNQSTAQSFIDSGNFLWNSGMFCFKAKILLEELEKYEPEVYKNALLAWQKKDKNILDEELSLTIPSISIDYAVMERSKKIKVVPALFEWSDLGSFESVYDYLKLSGHYIDDNGNMVIGTDVCTQFIGLQNTIFIFTNDAHLILQKECSQEVKELYEQIKVSKEYLL